MPLTDSEKKIQIVKQLRKVIDPELGVNIVDLGLVYQILIEDNKVKVQFTTTTPGCPLRRYLQQQVEKAVSSLEGIDEYEVEMVLKPVWTVDMIKEGVDFFSVSPPPRS
jgi:metal-sulfur cluster biosynthetic enzyme